MEGAKQQNSEVARLLTQIREEYEAGVAGVQGFAYGAAQHQVIKQKVNRMYLWEEELGNLVGEDVARLLVNRELLNCPGLNP